ncbi:MAG: hypothetical protein LBP67_04785 [Bacteroidales bacterium]|nr:hypothetical protein [Bacteroidales bacterium]
MREILPKLTNKIGDENLDVRSKLKIDGFYRYYNYHQKFHGYDGYKLIKSNSYEIDSTAYNFILYEDGTVIHHIYFKNNSSTEDISKNMSNNVEVINTRGKPSWGTSFGIYAIHGDTIIMQIIKQGDVIVPWSFFERKFLIIDDTTLKYFSYQDLLSNTAIQFENNNSLAHFIQADSIPPANPWFKEKRWAWKNEEEWKDYIKSKPNKTSK